MMPVRGHVEKRLTRQMSDSSRRRLRCSCGARVARMWHGLAGGFKLYIKCEACGRMLESDVDNDYFMRKDGKRLAFMERSLLEKWKKDIMEGIRLDEELASKASSGGDPGV